LKSNSNLV